MRTDAHDPGAPALRFEPAPERATAGAVPVAWVPGDALVLWESERADLYRRLLAVVVGNRLELLRISAGSKDELTRVAGVTLCEGPGAERPAFLTRDALVFWGDSPAGRRGVARTLLLCVGLRLVMVRLTADEHAPRVEVLRTLDLATAPPGGANGSS